MNEQQTTNHAEAFHIPLNEVMVPLSKTNKSVNLKPNIEDALRDDKVLKAIEVYKTNGGKTGDAKVDDVRAMDIIVAWDDEHGGTIKRSGLKEAQVLQQVNVQLRRRYVFDKKRKIIGINPKHYVLLVN